MNAVMGFETTLLLGGVCGYTAGRVVAVYSPTTGDGFRPSKSLALPFGAVLVRFLRFDLPFFSPSWFDYYFGLSHVAIPPPF